MAVSTIPNLTVTEESINLSGVASGTARFSKVGKQCVFCIDNQAQLSSFSKKTDNVIGTIPVGYRPKNIQRGYPLLSNGWGNGSSTYPLQLILNTNGAIEILADIDYPGSYGIFCNIAYVTA